MRLILVLAVLSFAACGGNASVVGPTSPTGPTGHIPPTTNPTPTPLPSPGTLPPSPGTVPASLVGNWAGTAVVVTSFVTNSYNTCSALLFVTGQANGQFFGFLQLTGGTVTPCGQSGSAFGSVGVNGSISLSFNLTGDKTACSSVSDEAPLTGLVAGDTITVSQTVHRSCTTSTSAFSQDGIQSLSLSLRR